MPKIHWPINDDEKRKFLNFAKSTIPYFDYNELLATACLITSGGKKSAVIAYTGVTTTNLEMHIGTISNDWGSRKILAQIFHYPFTQLGLQRVTAIIDISNENAIEFVSRVGFKAEGLVRELYPNKRDGLIFGMLRRECKWLGHINDSTESTNWAKNHLQHQPHQIQ